MRLEVFKQNINFIDLKYITQFLIKLKNLKLKNYLNQSRILSGRYSIIFFEGIF